MLTFDDDDGNKNSYGDFRHPWFGDGNNGDGYNSSENDNESCLDSKNSDHSYGSSAISSAAEETYDSMPEMMQLNIMHVRKEYPLRKTIVSQSPLTRVVVLFLPMTSALECAGREIQMVG